MSRQTFHITRRCHIIYTSVSFFTVRVKFITQPNHTDVIVLSKLLCLYYFTVTYTKLSQRLLSYYTDQGCTCTRCSPKFCRNAPPTFCFPLPSSLSLPPNFPLLPTSPPSHPFPCPSHQLSRPILTSPSPPSTSPFPFPFFRSRHVIGYTLVYFVTLQPFIFASLHSYCMTVVHSAGKFYDEDHFQLFRVHVDHTGEVRWGFGGVMETSCHLDGTLFPFDSQACSIVVQSWAYSEAFVDLRNSSSVVHLENFNDDGKLIHSVP